MSKRKSGRKIKKSVLKTRKYKKSRGYKKSRKFGNDDKNKKLTEKELERLKKLKEFQLNAMSVFPGFKSFKKPSS